VCDTNNPAKTIRIIKDNLSESAMLIAGAAKVTDFSILQNRDMYSKIKSIFFQPGILT
jgi:hypothetical protein